MHGHLRFGSGFRPPTRYAQHDASISPSIHGIEEYSDTEREQ